jgi:hypothetical protein
MCCCSPKALGTGAIIGLAAAGAVVVIILALAFLRPCCRRQGKDRRLVRPGTSTRRRPAYSDDIPEMVSARKQSDDSAAYTPNTSRTQLIPSATAVKSAAYVMSPMPPRRNRLHNVVQSVKRSLSNAPDPTPPAESEWAEVVDAPSVLKNQIAYVPPALRAGPKPGNNTAALASPRRSSGERSSKLANPFASEQSAFQ